MNQLFTSVWYATPEKAESMAKFMVFSDRGSLELLPDEIQYCGKKVTVAMPNVVAVSLTTQRIPLLAYAITNVAVVAYFAVMYAEKLNLGVLAGLLVVANLLGLLIGASMKWVMVEYHDESDQPRKAFFAVSGWAGILGGTGALYRAIKQHCHVGE
jgi:hypothetical protein